MNPASRRGLFWAPRVLTLAFALFLSVFALDVFEMGLGPSETAVALLMHLTPVFAVLIVLAVAWRREWVGALLFTAFAILYVAWGWGRFGWSSLFLAVPLVVIALLFLLSRVHRMEHPGGPPG